MKTMSRRQMHHLHFNTFYIHLETLDKSAILAGGKCRTLIVPKASRMLFLSTTPWGVNLREYSENTSTLCILSLLFRMHRTGSQQKCWKFHTLFVHCDPWCCMALFTMKGAASFDLVITTGAFQKTLRQDPGRWSWYC